MAGPDGSTRRGPVRPLHVVVDAANVIGSRPDGWWRDRPGAARRLAGRLVEALTTYPGALARAVDPEPDGTLRIHLVLEGVATRAENLPRHPDLTVHRARTDGDSAVVDLVEKLSGTDRVVITADRGLRERVLAAGATVAGPGALLRVLPD